MWEWFQHDPLLLARGNDQGECQINSNENKHQPERRYTQLDTEIKDDILKSFLDFMEKSPELAKDHSSIHVLSESTLNNNEEHMSSSISKIDVNNNDFIPNKIYYESNKSGQTDTTIVINNSSKKKYKISLHQLAMMAQIFPNLKSIRTDQMNYKIEKSDAFLTANCNNNVEHIDIVLGNAVTNPSILFNFILETYHKNLKSLRLCMLEDKTKWNRTLEDDNGKCTIDKVVNKSMEFENLESLEISFCKYLINTDRFFSALVHSKCKLKHLTLLGCIYGDSIFYFVKKFYDNSLESLKLSTQEYLHPSALCNMKKLKHFSYLWDISNEKVDILQALMILPNLISLELGFNRGTGDLASNVINSEIYSNLNHLAFTGLNFEGHELLNIGEQLPNLKVLIFKRCKFGRSRAANESTISLDNYTLDKLVIKSCSLYCSKKEKKNNRLITRFKFRILMNEPYATKIASNNDDRPSLGSLYHGDDTFVYDINKPEKPHLDHTLLISIKFMKLFSINSDFIEYISFLPEAEIETNNVFTEEEDVIDYSANESFTEDTHNTYSSDDADKNEEQEQEQEQEEEDDEEEDEEEEETTPVIIIRVGPKHKKKMAITISEDEYTSGHMSDSTTDSEYDDRRGPLRRSTRKINRVTTRSSRKRNRSLSPVESYGYYSSEDYYGNHEINSELVSEFVQNVRRYKAVIRLKTKSNSLLRSPSL